MCLSYHLFSIHSLWSLPVVIYPCLWPCHASVNENFPQVEFAPHPMALFLLLWEDFAVALAPLSNPSVRPKKTIVHSNRTARTSFPRPRVLQHCGMNSGS